MKYTISINQRGIVEKGLLDKTDLIDWAIIDYLTQWYLTGTKRTVQKQDNIYVWINYRHLLSEMPLLKIQSKDALTKRFGKLKELGLINTFRDKDNTLYFTLTPLTLSIIAFSDVPPAQTEPRPVRFEATPVRFQSTPVRPKSDRAVRPKSDSTNSIPINSINNINNNTYSANIPDWVPRDALDAFIEMRKKIKKPLTPHAMRLLIGKLTSLRQQGQDVRAVLEQSVFHCWQGVFPVKQSAADEEPTNKALKTIKEFRKTQQTQGVGVGVSE